MEKQFVSFALAVALKEKGFEEPCFGIYDTAIQNTLSYGYCGVKGYTYNVFTWKAKKQVVLAPTHQQAIDWLFKKLDFYYPYLKIEIFSDGSGSWYHPQEDGNDKLEIDFDKIEQAIEEGLKLIK